MMSRTNHPQRDEQPQRPSRKGGAANKHNASGGGAGSDKSKSRAAAAAVLRITHPSQVKYINIKPHY